MRFSTIAIISLATVVAASPIERENKAQVAREALVEDVALETRTIEGRDLTKYDIEARDTSVPVQLSGSQLAIVKFFLNAQALGSFSNGVLTIGKNLITGIATALGLTPKQIAVTLTAAQAQALATVNSISSTISSSATGLVNLTAAQLAAINTLVGLYAQIQAGAGAGAST